LQRRFREARLANLGEDALLWVEHPPLVTFGRAAKTENLVWSPERLRAQGLDVFQTERGGDVTYHGPGQLVGYPILNLAPDRKDVRRYVRDLEETLIRALSDLGISAHRESKWPGVWVGSAEDGSLAKIAALGVHISKWVTTHGFALNVDPNLSHFQSIVPCGIQEAGVTSIAQQLARAPSLAEMQHLLERAFAEVFEATLIEAPAPKQTVSVYVTRKGSEGPELLLLRRRPGRGGFWQPVTGKVELGESTAKAAKRELHEETGIQATPRSLDYVHTFGWGDGSPSLILEECAFAADFDEPTVALSDEHDAMEWCSLPTALERLPFAGLREGARRAVASLARAD
jgi:lipoyl(octanoyl) transferase